MTGEITRPHADDEGGTVANSHREGPRAHQPRRSAVHRDQKIGLALAVLILGFTGAFCFRNPPLADAQPLAMHDAAELDARIEQLPIRAYTQREGVGTESRRQPGSLAGNVSSDLRLADQVIRFGSPGSKEVPAGGDLVDLFPGPPEPVLKEHLPQPLIIVGSPGDNSDSSGQKDEPILPLESVVRPQDAAVSPVSAEQPTLAPPSVGPRPSSSSYVVKSGDTLSGIALKVYGVRGSYLDLYRANRDVLADPNDLPVGTTLRIP